MNFLGFSIPDGAYLPPELVYLLPYTSEAKLKILIAVIYHNTQIAGGEPLSLSDIERITGLSRPSVTTALQDLIADGMLERQAIGNSYSYEPVVRPMGQIVKNFYYPDGQVVKNFNHLDGESVKVRESDSRFNLINKDSPSDSLNLAGNSKNFLLAETIKTLRAAGVYLKTAQDLVNRFDRETIERHLDYYRHALKTNLAQGPGWLVMSLNEDWPAPLGYSNPENDGHKYKCPYCEQYPCVCEDEEDDDV